MTPEQLSPHLTNMRSLQQQMDNAALDCREVLSDAAAAVPKTVTTSVRQIFISTWSLACFAGMVVIAGIFISQRTRYVLYQSMPSSNTCINAIIKYHHQIHTNNICLLFDNALGAETRHEFQAHTATSRGSPTTWSRPRPRG